MGTTTGGNGSAGKFQSNWNILLKYNKQETQSKSSSKQQLSEINLTTDVFDTDEDSGNNKHSQLYSTISSMMAETTSSSSSSSSVSPPSAAVAIASDNTSLDLSASCAGMFANHKKAATVTMTATSAAATTQEWGSSSWSSCESDTTTGTDLIKTPPPSQQEQAKPIENELKVD